MLQITASEYWTEIELIARDLEKRYVESDIDELSDAVHEIVDSHLWIIYYSYNLDIMYHTHNQDYGVDARLIDLYSLPCESFSSVMQVFAFWAMYADIMDEMQNESDLDEARQEYKDQQAEV